MNEKPTIICITPVKNEAWILDMFLQCTSLWADLIIIADQGSSDGSREIAQKYPKVLLIDNKSESYDEFARQKLLLSEARKHNGRRLLISLDADEIFTADFNETSEWQRIINANPGEVFGFRWINICRNFIEGWESDHFGWAYMDDGAKHEGSFIHSPRIPISNPDAIIKLEQIKVLHYQYTNWSRMQSKHRYYQCLERINYPDKNAVDIFRMYHHMYKIDKKVLKPLKSQYFRNYQDKGINTNKLEIGEIHWFDFEILNMFDKYGVSLFRKESIWDIDWNHISETCRSNRNQKILDPRNLFDKFVHYLLKKTQRYSGLYLVRKADRILKRIW
jgi:glycosyltransferase involved in cell wall biosynthesis